MAFLQAKYLELPSFIRNKYTLISISFVVYMIFFAQYNAIGQYQRKAKLEELNQQKAHFEEQIDVIANQKEALFGSNAALEKFAREHYGMKRDNEEIFIVEWK